MKSKDELLQEKFGETKRLLLLLPKNERKAVLESGLRMARLKRERDSLLKAQQEKT